MISPLALPNRIEQAVELRARADVVFDRLDDFEQLGAHMMRSSWMMAGSRMHYELDQAVGRRVGAHVRLRGSFLGMEIAIDEQVIEHSPPLRKTWQTTGSPRVLILAGYRMGFVVTPRESGCRLEVFIDYALPERGAARWLGWIAGSSYARWCVTSMIAEAERMFGRADQRSRAAGDDVGRDKSDRSRRAA